MWALLMDFLASIAVEWRLWKWIHDPPLKGDRRPITTEAALRKASFVSYVTDRVFMIAAFGAGTVLLSASVIGYDLLGDRNNLDSPAWVAPPVWSEVFFGGAAIALGIYLFKRRTGV